MTISLDDPLFNHYLEERPTLTYAQPDDPWAMRQLILGIENLFGRRKVQRLYDTLKSQPFELRRGGQARAGRADQNHRAGSSR